MAQITGGGEFSSFDMGRHEAQRRSETELAIEADALVEKVARGKSEAAPWENPHFRIAVLRRLYRSVEWKRDSEKLAIVKEVFGGK